MQKYIRKAICRYNENFLVKKNLNINFLSFFIDSELQKKEELKHEEKDRSLLEAVRKIQSEIERVNRIQNKESYYALPEGTDNIHYPSPKNELDGYLFDAVRAYFLHTLQIHSGVNPFDKTGDCFFDFKLNHMLESSDLVDSLEVKRTRDWALIGQALALREIQKKTKKKGRKKQFSSADEARDIDLKRADFVEDVHNYYYEERRTSQDYATITDLEIITTYRQMLTEKNGTNEIDLSELEHHIRLKNITDNSVFNSISKGRNDRTA